MHLIAVLQPAPWTVSLYRRDTLCVSAVPAEPAMDSGHVNYMHTIAYKIEADISKNLLGEHTVTYIPT